MRPLLRVLKPRQRSSLTTPTKRIDHHLPSSRLGRFHELYARHLGADHGVFKSLHSASDARLKQIEAKLGEGYLAKLNQVRCGHVVG